MVCTNGQNGLKTNLNNTLPVHMDYSSVSNPKSIIEKFRKDLDLFPKGLRIATMTVIGRFDTKFFPINIGKCIDLSLDDIVTAKYGNGTEDIRTLITNETKSRRKKKTRKNFNNQCSLRIKVEEGKFVNTKVFVNGSIQIAGCGSLDNAIVSIEILCKALSKKKAIVKPFQPGSFTLCPFSNNTENVTLEKMESIKIVMINSNFKVNYHIDRERLHEIMEKNGIEHTYEPLTHSCVNIKYNYMDRKKISIFVFEKGSIIITGAMNGNHVARAYDFITDIFNKFKHEFIKHDIKAYLKDESIKKLISNNPLLNRV